MAEIYYENTDDIVVLKVVGSVPFNQISEAFNQYFPLVSKHLIWDYSEGDLDNVSPSDFKRVPDMCQAPGLFSSTCAKFIFQFSDQRASC